MRRLFLNILDKKDRPHEQQVKPVQFEDEDESDQDDRKRPVKCIVSNYVSITMPLEEI